MEENKMSRNTEDEELDRKAQDIIERIDRGEIKAYTYKDLLLYDAIREHIESKYKKETMVCEESEEYFYEEIDKPHDKLIKTILSDKKEAVQVINNKLGTKIGISEIEKYTSSYITKEFKTKESDIVYKMKGRKIFFLIEHQSSVDRTMPYRLYEYSLEIMREAIDKEEEKRKGYLYPKVIPIVIYTGKEKWDIETNLEDVQEKLEGYNQNIWEYELIDINEYTEEELLEEKTMTAKIMLIEKEFNTQRILETLNKIVERTEKEEEKEKLYRIIEYLLSNKIEEENREKLLNKLRKGGEKSMTAEEILYNEYVSRYENGKKEGKKEGIKEGIKRGVREVARELLNLNIPTEKIVKATGISKKEIEKLKHENK